KRFDSVGVECDEQTRNDYRDALITAPGIEEYISGMIMFDETLRQSTVDGNIPFTKSLSDRGVLPGIKVDTGAKDLALHSGEKVTEGLDGLRDRLKEYSKLGAKFAKWRAVITIGNNMPSEACMRANAQGLARYAALCQEAGIVPIVEPEVIMDGDHTIERCYDVTLETLKILFDEIKKQECELDGLILKASMVISGKQCAEQASAEKVAEMSIKCYQESVPAEVPGIVFLSGGQSNEQATENLHAMNTSDLEKPWVLSFSYGRALQSGALKLWGKGDKQGAQKALFERAMLNGKASIGRS
ncbi:fructose-bisphosphate aldolase class I, partial [Candidatus Peregrinibacteria bacterium]|nr:fructose-bisphosphate aldolase class I [Candidatus Peregrinibacteria bacterium]